VVVQKDVLAMIREIQRELGSSILFVTHDMAVHANLADRLGIMYAGRLVEEGAHRRHLPHAAPSLHGASDRQPAAAWRHRAEGRPPGNAAQPRRSAARLPLSIPRCPRAIGHLPTRGASRWSLDAGTTRRLLPSGVGNMTELLELRSVSRTYGGGLFSRRQVRAVREVSLRLEQGRPEIFTVVGESGSGKTTLARMILGMVAPQQRHHQLPGHRPGDPPRRSGAAGLHAQGPTDLPESVRSLQPDETGRSLPVRDGA
jgi:ABC-type glutathione transport system ATPase component